MANKYRQLDRQLFAWLRDHREDATTAGAVEALGATEKTQQRHISRRFTQLEDRGVLKCTLRGTTRVCVTVAEIPESLEKQRWRPGINFKASPRSPAEKPIQAVDSSEYERLGGTIEKLPSRFDEPMRGSQPLGPSFFDDFD